MLSFFRRWPSSGGTEPPLSVSIGEDARPSATEPSRLTWLPEGLSAESSSSESSGGTLLLSALYCARQMRSISER